MTIDKSGQWWKGTEAGDLDAYLGEYAAGGYPPDRFARPVCDCGKTGFRIDVDDEAGFVRRACEGCGRKVVMLDGSDVADEASPEECACPCGAEVFELSVSFAHRSDGSLNWVAVGGRCRSCGTLGCYADWKIDYEPSDHLYAKV